MREQNNCLLAFIPRNEEKKNPMAESKLMLVVTLVSVVFVQVHSGNVPDNYGVRSGCEGTLYKDLCVSTMSTFPGSLQAGSRVDFCRFAMKLSVLEAQKAFALISRFGRRGLNGMQSGALYDCMELFGLTLDALNESLSNVTNSKTNYFKWRQAADVQTWLSASLTNQATCLDGLQESTGSLSKYVFTNNIRNVSRLVSNTLAMVKNVSVVGNNSTDLKKLSVHNRRLLSDLSDVRQLHVKDEFFSHYGSMKDGFPSWLSAADRRLLQTSDDYSIEAEDFVTVAQDGSGNYTTITDAINAAPNKSDDRHVIYVTEGVYQEYIEVPKYKTNIMLIGDGINATVITGNRSVVDGWTTFRSATFAVVGQGFLARDITFENTAGPEKHQAVALRVGSDLSAFYRCSMRGYQDTLYAHSLRQFYRECDIYGTVDFIFGNAAVVFQTCNILPRRPMANQKIALTAQGREDPNQNTGTSVQNCTVTAAPDLIPVQSSFQIFLGRPWKEYSRTVYLQSYLDNLIDPAGWLEWSGDFALSTLYYGEYMNSGPGAGTASRVTWPGYHVMNISDANNFTVAELIAGDSWLRSSAVPFDAVLN